MKNKLDSYIDNVEHLPATPSVLVKLIALFRRPDRDVDEIVELMRQDPSLTADVLRYSNSAYFGSDECIMDIFEAVMRLGFYQVYQTAVARFGLQTLCPSEGAPGIDVEKLWRHSAAAAATAGVIAKKIEEPEGLAFTAGLLHDVGKIVLASAEGAAYAALCKEVGDSGSELLKQEQRFFGFQHCEVGGRLLERWGLPEEISFPVRYHHRVGPVQKFERLCAIVSLGNRMAHAVEASSPEKEFKTFDAVFAMGVLKLGEDDLAGLLKDAQKDIERLQGLISVKK
jgi:putative nucleotidyltransferase with HDIG domain